MTQRAHDQARAQPGKRWDAKLPRDQRGYIIPWVVYRDRDGRAHFTINDDAKREHVLKHDLCPICGKKLFRGRWFVGGPASAFHPRGAYIDPPMHYECAHYALEVCPYLAAPNYSKRLDDKLLPEGEAPMLMDPTMDPTRPDVFVAVMATGQRIRRESIFQSYITPKRPYLRVEFWRHGRQVDGAGIEESFAHERADA